MSESLTPPPYQPRSRIMRAVWFSIAIISLFLGILGAFLPLLPTTPFILLAAAGFARSSQRMHDWLLNHRHLGPCIHNWREHRAISPKAKRTAIVMLVVAFGISVAMQVNWKILIVQAVLLSFLAVMIMTRPSGPNAQRKTGH